MDYIMHFARQVLEEEGHEDHDHDHDAPSTGGGHSHGSGSCEFEAEEHDYMSLRIAAVFVLLVGSTLGALFPVIARRASFIHIPKAVFDFAKYFGSGIIISTAFIHLLGHALHSLESPCLSEDWGLYPYALAICMASIFCLFIVELIAFRWGTAKLASLGKTHDAHGHGIGAHSSHGPEGGLVQPPKDMEKGDKSDDGSSAQSVPFRMNENTLGQIIGIAILEFGVVLHSILIGLTLAVDHDFKVLFVVVLFHQTFEGIGIGSRLAYMDLPPKYKWVPYAGAILYGVTTPLGIAAGLGARTTYNAHSATASIVAGVLDSISAGILLYTGLVELLAHDFLFSKEMMNASNKKLSLAIGAMLLGAGLMSLLGRWA
ncbi:ZIP zinc/iron transport family [Coprinopsis marcescibilis]|uniref:ZIP zinc/iron transport family n=1 Tax=Coprinopsis marcescibilis TaxID=230819 RepID=A0A5C3L004_COPMA|nr:ZIP zinc/iron transport family [Coprinopsis marcescibilis]